jgi:drug/metabolite transporter (DMT)-like permease
MLIALYLALGSAISGAIANLLARRIVREVRARDMVAVNFLLMTLMLLPGLPWFWHVDWSNGLVLRIAIAVLIDSAGNILYFYSFEHLEPVVASAMLSISPLLGLFVAPFFTGAVGAIGFGQVLGVFLITGGLYTLALQPLRTALSNGGEWSVKQWLIYIGTPILAALLFTISIFIMRADLASGAVNSYSYYLIEAVIALLTAFITRPNLTWVAPRSILITSERMVFVLAQWLLLLTAIQMGNAVVVKAIADSTPFFVVLISWLLLRQKLPRTQWAGALLVVAGISSISLF